MAIRYVFTTMAWMALFYAVLYQPWPRQSLPGKWLGNYLELIAAASASSLELLGENVSLNGAIVSGRFSYSVVVDCAALDVQAFFVAAVLAFPSGLRSRVAGLVGGTLTIFTVNIVRLVVLYYAGLESLSLFKTLHEEVFVLLVVGLVCGVFLLWARWAIRSATGIPPQTATGTVT
jgi:exosortase/archaeosortase family protein